MKDNLSYIQDFTGSKKNYKTHLTKEKIYPFGKFPSNEFSWESESLIRKTYPYIDLEIHSSYVKSVAFSPCGQYIAAGSSDESISVWNLLLNTKDFNLIGHSSQVTSISFSSDGNLISSGSSDNKVIVWSFIHKAKEFSLKGHSGVRVLGC